MPAEDRVVIHVEVDADLGADRAKIEAFYRSLEQGANRVDKRIKSYDKTLHKVTRTQDRFEKALHKTRKALSSVFNAFGSFLGLLGKFSFVGMAIEIGLVSIALLSVKAALVTGRFAIRAYQATLTALGITAGGVAVALGSIAAVMRQFQEVSLIPQLGTRGASIATRGVLGDQLLSFFGMEGLNTAVAALAQGGVDTRSGYSHILRQLGDFTSDPKQLADLATVYAQIQQQGIVSTDSLASLGGVNASLVSGIGELMGLDSRGLEKAADRGGIQAEVFSQVIAGQAEATNAFEGQLARLNATVLGQLKGLIVRMLSLFADLGQPFLQQITNVISSVETIVTSAVTRIRGSVTRFGSEQFLPGLLAAFEKFTDFMVVLTNDSLPKVEGWVDGMISAWDKTKNFFIDMMRYMAPLEKGADTLWDFMKRAFGPFFSGFGSLLQQMNKLLTDNADTWAKFGDSIGKFVNSLFAFMGQGNRFFVEAMPVWGAFFDTLAEDFMPIMADFFSLIHHAALTALPVVAQALSAVASALRPIVQVLTQLLSIPGIGTLLSLVIAGSMFGGTRGLMAAGLLGRQGAARTGGLLAAMGGASVGAASSVGPLAGPAFLAMSGLKLAGGSAAIAAGSGFAGYMGGGFVGNKVGGQAGELAGAGIGMGLGATTGAIIGSMVFPGPGTLVGAIGGTIIGGIAGVLGAQSAHNDIRKAAQQAAQSAIDGLRQGLGIDLAQGRNMQAYSSTVKQLNVLMGERKDLLGEEVNADGEYVRLWYERHKLQQESAIAMDFLNENLDHLQDASGLSSAKLLNLADIMGVDLTTSIGSMVDTLKALGVLADRDFTRAGVFDNNYKILEENLYGKGSFFEQQIVAPEMLDTVNAFGNTLKPIFDAGGTPDSGQVRGMFDSIIAYAQTKFGVDGGAALAWTIKEVIPQLNEQMNTDYWSQLLPDLERTFIDITSPEGKSGKALYAAIYDAFQYHEGELTSPTEQKVLADAEFVEQWAKLGDVPIEDFGRVLGSMLERWSDSTAIDRMAMFNDSVANLSSAFDVLIGKIYSFLGIPNPSKPKPESRTSERKPGGPVKTRRRWIEGDRDSPFSPNYVGPTGSTGTTSVQGGDTNVRTSITNHNTFDDLDAFIKLIAEQAGDATRNAAQRRAEALASWNE